MNKEPWTFVFTFSVDRSEGIRRSHPLSACLSGVEPSRVRVRSLSLSHFGVFFEDSIVKVASYCLEKCYFYSQANN